jgi:tetratricopeptide (TPR) repeat protein
MILVLVLSACSKEKSIEEHLEDGRSYLESGDLSKAIAALEEVVKRDPALAEAHRLLGEALGRSERWPEAVMQFEAYQALASDDAEAYLLLGQAYAQTGDLAKAAVTFAEGVRIDPSFLDAYEAQISDSADAILQAGQEALDAGDLGTANELLNLVAPLVPGQGEVYYLLGQAHLKADETGDALDAFADAVSLSPELATEHAEEINALAQTGLEMGQAALDAGDLEQAAGILGAVTTLLPGETRAHFLLGNIFNQTNQFERAIGQYQTVLRLDPSSSSAHTNMGVVFYKLGDLETAIKEYKAALELEPDDADTRYLLGAAYVQMDQLDEGRSEFELALTLDDQLAPAYIGLGNVYLLQGDAESARTTAEKATALDPNSPEAFFLLGQVEAQLGNIEEARAALERVLSLSPDPRWQEETQRLLQSLGSQ